MGYAVRLKSSNSNELKKNYNKYSKRIRKEESSYDVSIYDFGRQDRNCTF